MPRPTRESYDDSKPPYSYVYLTAMAIMRSKDKMCTLSEIYTFIMETFPFYQKDTSRWQNSLRHNLSFNDCFIKIPRRADQPGKGAYWMLNPLSQDMFENGSAMRRRKRFKMTKEEKEALENGRLSRSPPTVTYNNNTLPPSMPIQFYPDVPYSYPPSTLNPLLTSAITEVSVNTPRPRKKRQSFDVESLAQSSFKDKENVPTPQPQSHQLRYPIGTTVSPNELYQHPAIEHSNQFGLYRPYPPHLFASTQQYSPVDLTPIHPDVLRSLLSLRERGSSTLNPLYNPNTAKDFSDLTPSKFAELIEAPSAFKPTKSFYDNQDTLFHHYSSAEKTL